MELLEHTRQYLKGASPVFVAFPGWEADHFPKVHAFASHEFITYPMLSNALWNQVLGSEAFRLAQLHAGIIPVSGGEGFPIVVTGEDGYESYLVFFHPQYPSEYSKVLEIPPHSVELESAWESWSKPRVTALQDLRNPMTGSPRLASRSSFELERLMDAFPRPAASVTNEKPLPIIMARTPRLEGQGIPSPPFGVAPDSMSSPIATAGVLARDGLGMPGLTTARHCLAEPGDAAKGKEVAYFQGGSPRGTGVVSRDDVLTDSCWFPIDTKASPGPTCHQASPLVGVGPAYKGKVLFEGLKSGACQTVVTGTAPQIPSHVPGMQAYVTTPPVTSPGDSGAALWDGNRNLLGFCSTRTGLGEEYEFSLWIWAHSVYMALGLET